MAVSRTFLSEFPDAFWREVAVERHFPDPELYWLLSMIVVHSPQSRGHFNLVREEYDFSNEKLQDNTDVLPPNQLQ